MHREVEQYVETDWGIKMSLFKSEARKKTIYYISLIIFIKTEMEEININIPQNYTGKDIVFKVQEKKQTEIPNKFRSFCIPTSFDHLNLIINGKEIKMIHLYELLKDHGLPETIPIIVSLNPTTFLNFDWNPIRGMPSSWPFIWNEINCSLTCISQKLCIRIFNLTHGCAESILDDIGKALILCWKNPVPQKSLSIYTVKRSPSGYSWNSSCTRLQRDMDTIYIDKDVKKKIIEGLKNFYDSSSIYDKFGVTWKRVHMFYGVPGSGKTSLILALASLFSKNIAKITITPDLNSSDIESLFQSLPQNTFLLLEDADALFTKRESNTSIDFSTMLNCMDGIATQRGLVLFMTTNYIEHLDQAFMRPGRVDISVEFNLPTKVQLLEALNVLGSEYIHEHETYLELNKNISIAGLQQHLFECIMANKASIL